MKLLVVSATKLEIPSIISFAKRNKNVDVLITGVGGAATSYAVTKALSKQRYDLLIQLGIAGSFTKELVLGQAVVVASDCFGDLGVEEAKQFQSVFDMGLEKPNERPFKNGKLVNPNKKLIEAIGLKKVNSASVNEVSTTRNRISYFGIKLGADIESMEGAAFHYVALKEKLPFLQIRAISNKVGERNKQKWKIADAIAVLNSIGLKLITDLTKSVRK